MYRPRPKSTICRRDDLSENHRPVRDFVLALGAARVVAREMRAHGLDAIDHAGLEAAVAKRLLHAAADPLPLGGADASMDAAVGENLNVAVGEQQVDQHAVVALGVPDAPLREHVERAIARRAAL